MILDPHDKVLIDGHLVEIGEGIAKSFSEGDRLLATPSSGLLLVPKVELDLVGSCVDGALHAFSVLSKVDDAQLEELKIISTHKEE